MKKAPRTAHGKDISSFGLNVKKFQSREYDTTKYEISIKDSSVNYDNTFTSIFDGKVEYYLPFFCKLRNKVIIV